MLSLKSPPWYFFHCFQDTIQTQKVNQSLCDPAPIYYYSLPLLASYNNSCDYKCWQCQNVFTYIILFTFPVNPRKWVLKFLSLFFKWFNQVKQACKIRGINKDIVSGLGKVPHWTRKQLTWQNKCTGFKFQYHGSIMHVLGELYGGGGRSAVMSPFLLSLFLSLSLLALTHSLHSPPFPPPFFLYFFFISNRVIIVMHNNSTTPVFLFVCLLCCDF